ncbi:uncharacterized protein [Magallana gigas]|uniref:uncharacterized protein isoform X3 n=1 Tax=Magallana gigas TaxID=29159 RepID=UPI0033413854
MKPTIMNDERSLIICFMVVGFISISMGSLNNSPCKKTSDWSNYVIRCPTNHTIYITKHVIEDGFNRLQYPVLGCSASDAVYCSGKLPINNTMNLKNHGVFESAVNACNGRTECSLNKNYFLNVESSVKMSCSSLQVQELEKASFRQSIYYECNPDSLIKDTCLTSSEIKSLYGHLYLKTSSTSCSCRITGSIARLKILQTACFTLMIQSNGTNIFEHQNGEVGLYGVDIPIQAENLVIMIMNGSNASFALIKVFGNYSAICNKYSALSTTSPQNMTFTSTHFPVHSSGRGHTHDDISATNKTKGSTTTQTAENYFSSMTGRELTSNDLIENITSWIYIVVVILAIFVSLIIFLICVYCIKQRKDRNLLLTILQRLNDGCINTDDSHFKTAKIPNSPSRPSDDDPNYREIPNNLNNNPTTKQHTNPGYDTDCPNPGYDTDCPKSVNTGKGQDDAEVTSLDGNGQYFKLEKSYPKEVV